MRGKPAAGGRDRHARRARGGRRYARAPAAWPGAHAVKTATHTPAPAKAAVPPAAAPRAVAAKGGVTANPLWQLMALGVQPKLAAGAQGGPDGGDDGACPACAARAPCPACEDERPLQRKAASATHTPAAPASPVPAATGQPLDATTAADFGRAFGADFSTVRIHVDAAAAALAGHVGALAYTLGEHIVFGRGQYPAGATGHLLLAHELAHVVQQRGGSRRVQGAGRSADGYEREADAAAAQAVAGRRVGPLSPARGRVQHKDPPDPGVQNPVACAMVGAIDGFHFVPVAGAKFQAGRADLQELAMVVKRLVGNAYTPELVLQLDAEHPIHPLFTPDLGIKQGGEPCRSIRWGYTKNPPQVRFTGLLETLEKKGKPAQLSAEQRELVRLGAAAERSWSAMPIGILPAWYTHELYLSMLGNRGAVLRKFLTAMGADKQTWSDAAVGNKQIIAAADIGESLRPAAEALEAVRADAALTEHAVYQRLWPTRPPAPATPAAPQGSGQANGAPAAAPTTAPVADPSAPPTLEVAVGVLSYCDARPELEQEATDGGSPERNARGAKARKDLLDGYEVVERAAAPARFDPKAGDQKIADQPSQYSAPPYPAELDVYPQPEPPLFGVSTRGNYAFTMTLQLPNELYAAFQFHRYTFTRIEVDKAKMGELVPELLRGKAPEGKREQPGQYALLKHRLAMDERYNEADIQKYLGGLRRVWGPPGISMDPFAINAAMRFAGSVARTGIQVLFDPVNVGRLTFPKESLYVVQAKAEFEPGPRAAIRRPPSLAYMPVLARRPELIAEDAVAADVQELQDARDRLAAIATEKANADPDKLKALIEEEKRLTAMTGDASGLIAYQKAELTRQKAEAKDPEVQAKLQKALDRLTDIEAFRAKQGFGAGTQRLPGTFVNDEGQLIHLLIETQREARSDGKEVWRVNDATTPEGKTKQASGTKKEAVRKALLELFMDEDYGRGIASVHVDDEVISIPVQTRSGGKLFKETLENTSTALSVIAVVAAPFTDGASLILLVPAGIVGGVASGWNIIDRGIDGKFKCDEQFAMDVVNIVGAMVGLGAETQLAKRSLFVGGALLITGVGALGGGVFLMGRQLWKQIEALKDLPASLRPAAMMEIIGNAMLQAGIMVGAVLMARGRAASRKASGLRSSFGDWFETLNEETKKALKDDPELMKAYAAMDPVARDLLTLCASICIPKPAPSKAMIKRITRLGERTRDPKTNRLLCGMLHDVNASPRKLAELVGRLEKLNDADLEAAIHSTASLSTAVLYAFSETVRGGADPAQWSPEQKALRELTDTIVGRNKIPLDRFGKIMDWVRNTKGGDPLAMLRMLDELTRRNIPGTQELLAALGHDYRDFHKGAKWVIAYIDGAGLWDAVEKFEARPGDDIGRRWDAVISGQPFQFKSWGAFYDIKFLVQIAQDFDATEGFTRQVVKWAFENAPWTRGDPAEVRARMESALRRAMASGYPEEFAGKAGKARGNAIIAALPRIVQEVGIPVRKP